MEWYTRPSSDGNPNHMIHTKMTDEGVMITANHMNDPWSHTIGFKKYVHWGMMFGMGERSVKERKMFWEPTYEEKLTVLQEVGIWKQVALEVMPPQNNVVDRANVYHMFEFQDPNLFVYGISPIFKTPALTSVTEDGQVEYYLTKDRPVQYLYLRNKNGEELRWWRKQELKNQLVGAHRCAVEIIIKGMEKRDYTALVCLPSGKTMDFTLL